PGPVRHVASPRLGNGRRLRLPGRYSRGLRLLAAGFAVLPNRQGPRGGPLLRPPPSGDGFVPSMRHAGDSYNKGTQRPFLAPEIPAGVAAEAEGAELRRLLSSDGLHLRRLAVAGPDARALVVRALAFSLPGLCNQTTRRARGDSASPVARADRRPRRPAPP